jgi:hypothetical protein
VFGELALIYDSLRAATVTATEDSVLWTLSSADFRTLATRFMNENLQRRIAVLRKIPAFASLSDEQLRRVSAVMQEERFAPGMQICYQGEKLVPGVNDKFYTIAEGSVMVRLPPGSAGRRNQSPAPAGHGAGVQPAQLKGRHEQGLDRGADGPQGGVLGQPRPWGVVWGDCPAQRRAALGQRGGVGACPHLPPPRLR